MSDTDSFIEEVTEEVRRDRLFKLARRYGWIAVLAVVAIVGGAAWTEWQKAQEQAEAQATGDAILAALEPSEPAERATALQATTLEAEQAVLVRDLILSAEQLAAGEKAAAAQTLQALSGEALEGPEIYREIVAFKSVVLSAGEMAAEDRRIALEALAQPGRPLALLAQEQLALLDVEAGDAAAAIERLQRIALDAGVTAGLRRRATQLIVALGGEPEALPDLVSGQ